MGRFESRDGARREWSRRRRGHQLVAGREDPDPGPAGWPAPGRPRHSPAHRRWGGTEHGAGAEDRRARFEVARPRGRT